MRLIKKIIKFFDRHLIIPVTRFFVGIGRKLKIINSAKIQIPKSFPSVNNN